MKSNQKKKVEGRGAPKGAPNPLQQEGEVVDIHDGWGSWI